jgi:hypothetical protein
VPIIAKSDLIVVGEVVSRAAKWSEGKGSVIMTYITIAVKEYIKGSSPSAEIVLQYPGGEIKEDNIGAISTLIIPSFNSNEEVILMLELLPDHKHYVIGDLLNGKYSIDAKGKVSKTRMNKQEFIQLLKSLVAAEKS